jgi:hypothetical protein
MDGRDPEHNRWIMQSTLPARMKDTTPRPRFDETHRTAIRMYARSTGRDVVGELRRAYAQAQGDTARTVYGTMLQGLDALRLSEDEMAAAFTSGNANRLRMAHRELERRFAEDGRKLSDADAAPFLDVLLASLVDGVRPWRPVDSTSPMRGLVLHARREQLAVNAAGLPVAVRTAWADRVRILTPDQRGTIDPREPLVVYTIDEIVGFGNFVRVSVRASEQLRRGASQAPQHYASGMTWYLMRLGSEWVIVSGSSWVT